MRKNQEILNSNMAYQCVTKTQLLDGLSVDCFAPEIVSSFHWRLIYLWKIQ